MKFSKALLTFAMSIVVAVPALATQRMVVAEMMTNTS